MLTVPQRCAVVDVDGELVIDTAKTALKSHVVVHLDEIAKFCGVDIFLLGPKFASLSDGVNRAGEAGRDQRWRVAIYGDMESAEHAKTRILIFIDRLVSDTRVFGCEYSTDTLSAWTCRRRNYAGAVSAYCHLWQISEEYQAYRIGDEYSNLLPPSIFSSLQILPYWSPTSKPGGDLYYRRHSPKHSYG
jgi:hypothetical protein